MVWHNDNQAIKQYTLNIQHYSFVKPLELLHNPNSSLVLCLCFSFYLPSTHLNVYAP